MTIEKIATLKAKRLATKRKTIKSDNEDLGLGLGSGLAGSSSSELRGMLDFDFDATKDIINRERQWRNRTTVLQSSGKVIILDCPYLIIFMSVKSNLFSFVKFIGIFEKHFCSSIKFESS